MVVFLESSVNGVRALVVSEVVAIKGVELVVKLLITEAVETFKKALSVVEVYIVTAAVEKTVALVVVE